MCFDYQLIMKKSVRNSLGGGNFIFVSGSTDEWAINVPFGRKTREKFTSSKTFLLFYKEEGYLLNIPR